MGLSYRHMDHWARSWALGIGTYIVVAVGEEREKEEVGMGVFIVLHSAKQFCIVFKAWRTWINRRWGVSTCIVLIAWNAMWKESIAARIEREELEGWSLWM
jgi:hypothetical protein